MAEVGLIWADDTDLKAIYNYVESQRPLIKQFPTVQAQIEDFERWYQGLTWFDIHVMINDTIAEAARRRDAINRTLNQSIPADWVPADKTDRDPGSASGLAGTKPKEPLIPAQYKFAAAITGTAITTLVVLKKLHIL